jgi:hypothetical protein
VWPQNERVLLEEGNWRTHSRDTSENLTEKEPIVWGADVERCAFFGKWMHLFHRILRKCKKSNVAILCNREETPAYGTRHNGFVSLRRRASIL